MKSKNIKKTTKKRSAANSDMVNSYETSNIKFGKLDIVLKSFNSLPNVESFYENAPEISNFSRKDVILEHEKLSKVSDLKKDVPTPVIVPVSITPRFLFCNNNTISENLVTCWWCRLSVIPSNMSCFLPITYDELKNKHTKHGYFCSWECAKAFNFDLRDIKSSYRSYLIHRICRQLYGIKTAHSIKYAPHWSELNIYGGNVDKDLYLKKYKRTNLENIGYTRETIR